jgi:hypothetical protein
MKEHLLFLGDKAKHHARSVRNAFLKEKQGILSAWRNKQRILIRDIITGTRGSSLTTW